jgi:hypothetical protein
MMVRWAVVVLALVALYLVAPGEARGIRLPCPNNSGNYSNSQDSETSFFLSSNATVCVGNVVFGFKQIPSFSFVGKAAAHYDVSPTCYGTLINRESEEIIQQAEVTEMPDETALASINVDFPEYTGPELPCGRLFKYVIMLCCDPHDEEGEYTLSSSTSSTSSFYVCNDGDCDYELNHDALHMEVSYVCPERYGRPKQAVPTAYFERPI